MKPLKAYTYTLAECGMPADWKHTPFTLPLSEPTTDPQSADVFIVPWEIWQLNRAGQLDTIWQRLPHLKGNERRHVVFSCGEDTWAMPGLDAIWIRSDATRHVMANNPTCWPWPWPCADFSELVDTPESERVVDVGFQGWVSTPECGDAMEACASTDGLRAVMRGDRRFYGYVERDTPEEAARLAQSYRELLSQSRMWLCTRSRPEGVHRYRLWETMSAGRIAVLLGDGAVFPFGDRIDYSAFTFQIPENAIWSTGALCKAFLANTPPEELRERGQIGHDAWAKYLDRRRWPEILDMVVREALAKCQR